MKENFLRSNSFKIRIRVSIGIFLISIIGMLTPNAYGLKIVYSLAAILGAAEVHTLANSQEELSPHLFEHSLFAFMMLFFSTAAVWIMPSALLIIGVVLTWTSDVGAYMVGKTLGTKLIKTRPFPKVSPNKSWEGVFGGLLVPGLMIPLCNYLLQNQLPRQPLPILAGCLAGLCAIIGDTSESAFKRHCGVKDANDVLKHKFGFRHIEALLGGSEGHGGYYDRLDSMSVVLFFFGIVTVLFNYLPSI